MKKVKVLINFTRLAVVEKIAFYRNVLAKLTDNPIYPTPDVSLTEAKTAVDTFETSFLAAHDGGHTAVATMHDNEVAADAVFSILAAYVERIAAGDETKISSSGFQGTKQPISRQKATLAVNDGTNSGSVKLVAKAIDKAGAYIWQYAIDTLPATESDWLMAGTGTRSYYELTGLTVTAKYYFRVAAVTPEGTTDFSAPVLKVVV
jgi:hypothetical protein